MTKREVLQYMKEKRKEGYITHSLLLELYQDDEDVPPMMIDLVCHKPEKRREPVIIMGRELSLLFNKAMRDYWDTIQQKDIKEKTIQNFKTSKN